MSNIAPLINVLWGYLAFAQPLQKADYLLVLGSNDVRVAEYAAELYLQGWATNILFSGGFGRLTAGLFQQPEAQMFADIAMQQGVPEHQILVEPRSRNTGENIQYCQQLLRAKSLPASSAILLTKPYMQRRAYATCQKQWPALTITSAPHTFNEANYSNALITPQAMLDGLLGEVQRLMEYPSKGFIEEHILPEAVMLAYRKLVNWSGPLS